MDIKTITKKLLFTLLSVLSMQLTVAAQELKVASFELMPKDLSARVGGKVDNNGRKCALLKIYVDDEIAAVRGNVIGGIQTTGMEKSIFITHDSKEVELVFEHHKPLHINFEDYDYPTVTSQMVYVINLVEAGVPTDPAPGQPQSLPQSQPALSESKILAQAKDAYNEGYYDRAMTLFKSISSNAEAQNYLGEMYYNGQGVLQNYSEAVKWYRKGAEQGNASAQCNLGYMYDEGRGVSQDYSEAVRWYRKAAEQGNAQAQYNLGNMYANGRSVPQDDSEAVRWYRRAAEQGNARAQCNLGIRYERGQGVSQDYDEAVRLYRKAAKQGNVAAQKALRRLNQ